MDIRSCNIYVYGADELGKRIYILYDGIHYDALVYSASEAPSEEDVFIFHPSCTNVYDDCKRLASELHDKVQYVNLDGFSLKCLVCGSGLTGEKDAQTHAKETGHTNFGQIS